VRRDIAITVVARVGRLAAGLITSILTARALGAGGRGEYFLIVTLSTLVVQFGHLGLASSNTYQVAQDQRLLGRLLMNSVWVSALVGGAVSVALVGALSVLRPLAVDPLLLWLVVGLAPASLFYLLGSALLVGVDRIVAYNVLDLVANALVMVLIAAAAVSGAGVTGVIVASLGGWWIAAAALYVVLRGRATSARFDVDVMRSGVGFAAKTYLITLLGLLVLRGNTFVLETFRGSAPVGQLSIALQIADLFGILPTSVALVLFPRLVREGRAGWSTAVRTSLVVGALVTSACVVAGLVAGPLIPAVFGWEFEASVGILLALLPGVVFLSMLTVLSQFITAAGLPRSLVVAWIAAFGLVSVLGALTIPGYAGLGVAVSLSATYAVLYVLVVLIARRAAVAGQ